MRLFCRWQIESVVETKPHRAAPVVYGPVHQVSMIATELLVHGPVNHLHRGGGISIASDVVCLYRMDLNETDGLQ